MELEKFDLERALAGEPVITRLGKEVTQLVKFEADRQVYPLMGVLEKEVTCWTIDGRFSNDRESSDFDLFMKPKENAVWVNVFIGESGKLFVIGFHSEEEAKATPLGRNYLKTVKITEL